MAAVVLFAMQAAAQNAAAPAPAALVAIDAKPQIQSYGELAYRTYRDAYQAALGLQRAVDRLIAKPDVRSLARARSAWLAARPSYGQSEAFRFYGGPIDGGKADDRTAPAGLEGLINAWPLDEAFIDYVRGNADAGIIAGDRPITRASLLHDNAREDEADVTTGYHAIEFLLWGQDLNPNGAGSRSIADFVGNGRAERRRTYLKVTTDLLVEHLRMLVAAWAPGKDNYRALMLAMSPAVSLKNMLTGIATLSGFELASERLGTALDSGSQEDEQSCFSDSTHTDILANAVGIENVYFARYGHWHGAGIDALVRASNPDLARYLEKQIHTSVELARHLEVPFDRTLATPQGSPERAKVEALVKSLQVQADLLKQASSALGVPIVIGDD